MPEHTLPSQPTAYTPAESREILRPVADREVPVDANREILQAELLAALLGGQPFPAWARPTTLVPPRFETAAEGIEWIITGGRSVRHD